MKNALAACLALLLLFTGRSAALADKQDFTLVNKTGVEIHGLFVSPADKDDWEEDILGQDTLADGASVTVHFDRDDSTAKWDLKVTNEQDASLEWHNLNLPKISKLTLFVKDGEGTATYE